MHTMHHDQDQDPTNPSLAHRNPSGAALGREERRLYRHVAPCIRMIASLVEGLLACHQLLAKHANCSEHGEAAIVDLLGLNLLEFGGVRRLEAKRVETKISWQALLFLELSREAASRVF